MLDSWPGRLLGIAVLLAVLFGLAVWFGSLGSVPAAVLLVVAGAVWVVDHRQAPGPTRTDPTRTADGNPQLPLSTTY